jgi:hypothetical protein
MTHICRTLGLVTVGALTLIATARCGAQSAASYYEQGVNAFFAGRGNQAESYLSEAINYDSQDPRAYYFRAFALMRQGRCAEARGDMMTGAQLEAHSPRQVAIGSALERIQGPGRLMLEEIRRQARLEAGGASAPAAMGSTFQNPIARPGEEAVLRERRIVPLEEFLRPGGPRTVAEPAVQAPDELPAGTPAATMPADGAAMEPAEKATPAVPNPFEDDSQRPEPNAPAVVTPPQAVPTPPATPPQDDAEAPPAATPPADAGENPFNG